MVKVICDYLKISTAHLYLWMYMKKSRTIKLCFESHLNNFAVIWYRIEWHLIKGSFETDLSVIVILKDLYDIVTKWQGWDTVTQAWEVESFWLTHHSHYVFWDLLSYDLLGNAYVVCESRHGWVLPKWKHRWVQKHAINQLPALQTVVLQ